MQTTLIPAGGAAMVEFHLEVPGNYVLVDHSIFRAFNKGALAILEVSGEPRDRRSTPARRSTRCTSSDKLAEPRRRWPPPPQASASGTLTKEEQVKAGEVLFAGTCSTCHQDNGAGHCRTCSRRSPSPTACSRIASARSTSCCNGLTGPVDGERRRTTTR